MRKYNREIFKILSLSLLFFIFPNLVLADSASLKKYVEKKIAQMTLDEKVGQLFMVGFPQKKITPDLDKFISKYKPGSFLLFKRNITSVEQIRNLNSTLYHTSFKHTRLPPLLAIDQEGGSVSRLPIFPAQPNALAVGQTQSPLLAEEMGFQTGRFLREVGFNMNLAPVLDVSDPFAESFIGVRSFGSDASLVSQLGVAYARGLLKAHVVPTAKHFPGAGSLKADPHLKVVKNQSTQESLRANDLKPYEEYAKLGPRAAVMLSHLIYPALDESGEPASFSKKISTDLLRGDIKHQGLVLTDDLQMQGSRQLLRPEVAALRALKAGADVVMLTWSFADQGKAFEFVKAAVVSGDLSASELNEKLEHILIAKAFANIFRQSPDQESLLSGTLLTSQGYSNVESNVFDQNFRTSLLPSRLPEKSVSPSRAPASIKRICVTSPSKSFNQEFRKSSRLPVDFKLLSGNTNSKHLIAWIKEKKCAFILAAVTGKKTAATIRALPTSEKTRIVVVNLGAPTLIPHNNEFLRVLQLYFNHTDSGKKIAQYLDEILRDLETQLALN